MKFKIVENINEEYRVYTYKGAVYGEDGYINDMEIQTRATSDKQALNNIKYQIRKQYGYDNYYPINISMSNLSSKPIQDKYISALQSMKHDSVDKDDGGYEELKIKF